MKTMKKLAPIIKRPKYTGIKVTNTLRGLKLKAIDKHLTSSQSESIHSIDSSYRRNGYVTRKQMVYIWNLYWHFVLNDFRY